LSIIKIYKYLLLKNNINIKVYIYIYIMLNDYEMLDLGEDYINEINNNTINIDSNEYKNIIKKVINKNSILEVENKKKDIQFLEINEKYLNILDDFNNLNKNYSQIENDLYDMETVNIKLLDIIKKKEY
tara:strand:+ start:385 stop:771 length:387 start_codon:yes stop_codon:yes gene_type:complete